MSWSGVKSYVNKVEIETWCEDVDIENYTINSQGEIDVDGDVGLSCRDFKELPYKFGAINGFFTLSTNKELTSLKNCPYYVRGYFSCSGCPKLDSLKGCPKEVGGNFYCGSCKRKFTKEEIRSLCKVGTYAYVNICI